MIDDRIKIRTLTVRELTSDKHTANYLKTVFLEVLNEFNVSFQQIFIIKWDNGKNMNKSTKQNLRMIYILIMIQYGVDEMKVRF